MIGAICIRYGTCLDRRQIPKTALSGRRLGWQAGRSADEMRCRPALAAREFAIERVLPQ